MYEVDVDGGADFTTIQEAIDAAVDGYIIFIHDGVYNEHITVNKKITVQGETRDSVILEGSDSGTIITVNHAEVALQTMTLRNAGHGIDVSSSFVSISGLTIDNMGKGVVLNGAQYTSLLNTTISNCSLGCWIKSSSHNTTIIKNNFYDLDNALNIIDSNDQRITQNSFKRCRLGIILSTSTTRNIISSNTINTTHFGIIFYYSSFNIVQSNSFLHQGIILCSSEGFPDIPIYYTSHTIEDNTLDGKPIYYYSQQQNIEVPLNAAQVILADCQNMLIQNHEYSHITNPIQIVYSSDCTIANVDIDNSSDSGILVGFSSDINIAGSTIRECQYNGMMLGLNSDMSIIHNNFIDNTHQVWIDEGGLWDDGYPLGGNYWSDYSGLDANNDGIGDTPYQIITGVYDNYPFMNPNAWESFTVKITAPKEVDESTSFTVSALVQDSPHRSATIKFAGQQYTTSQQGICTVTAPAVNSDTTYTLIVEKYGYPSTTASILVRDTSSPAIQQYQLTLVTPESVIEGNQFMITVHSDNQPVSNVQISFNSQIVYTSSAGTAALQAPEVEKDTPYSIQAVKTGYISDETTIIVHNQNSSITLHSPNGGESYHDTIQITWTITSTEQLNHHGIFLYYQYHNGLWVAIAEDLSILSSSYSWNSTALPDGYPYLVKVVLKEDSDMDTIYETSRCEDISDAPFAIDNSLTHQGWVQGIVYETVNDTQVPIVSATVYVILSNINNIITSKCMFTNESGEYRIPVQAGIYSMIAGKIGYSEAIISNVTIWVNQTTQVNISLERGSSTTFNFFILNKNRDEINTAIRNQQVGGELSISQGEETSTFEKHIFMYDSVTITPTDITKTEISLLVNGDEKSTGRTIVINLDKNIVDLSKEFTINYDEELLTMADDLADVLDPNNDGLHAEYLLTKGAMGMQVIISIPHFSEHQITISSVIEAIGGLPALLLYITVITLLGCLYIIPFFLIRKSK